MATTTVVPTERELKVIDFSNTDVQDLIREAEANDIADRSLTVMEALKKYKKAVFWAMFLSTSLIMEGYDVVIVSQLEPIESLCVIVSDMIEDHLILRADAVSRALRRDG